MKKSEVHDVNECIAYHVPTTTESSRCLLRRPDGYKLNHIWQDMLTSARLPAEHRHNLRLQTKRDWCIVVSRPKASFDRSVQPRLDLRYVTNVVLYRRKINQYPARPLDPGETEYPQSVQKLIWGIRSASAFLGTGQPRGPLSIKVLYLW